MHLKQLSPRSQKRMENCKSSEEIRKPKNYKIVVIGAGGVGKSGKSFEKFLQVFSANFIILSSNICIHIKQSFQKKNEYVA